MTSTLHVTNCPREALNYFVFVAISLVSYRSQTVMHGDAEAHRITWRNSASHSDEAIDLTKSDSADEEVEEVFEAIAESLDRPSGTFGRYVRSPAYGKDTTRRTRSSLGASSARDRAHLREKDVEQ